MSDFFNKGVDNIAEICKTDPDAGHVCALPIARDLYNATMNKYNMPFKSTVYDQAGNEIDYQHNQPMCTTTSVFDHSNNLIQQSNVCEQFNSYLDRREENKRTELNAISSMLNRHDEIKNEYKSLFKPMY